MERQKHCPSTETPGSESDLIFADEEQEEFSAPAFKPWKIVVADDEEQIHAVTRMALAGYSFEGRRLDIFSAYSGEETKRTIAQHPDTALLLLDVVMERDDAGLDVVHYIRHELKNALVRIILRTGQPGQAPEGRVIADYDINDYREKTELTVQRLHTIITASLRSYRDILTIEEGRRGLEILATGTSRIFEFQSFPSFLEGALMQLMLLMRRDGEKAYPPSGFVLSHDNDCFSVLAGTGIFRSLVGTSIDHLPEKIREELKLAVVKRESLFLRDSYIGYFRTRNSHESVFYMQNGISETNKRLLMIFASNLAVAFDNFALSEEINETQREIILTLGEVVETRSQDTANHVRRVGEYCYILGKQAGLDEESANLLRAAAPMHDVGKIGIPDAILNKPGRLSSEEFEVIKTHTTIGYHILKNSTREMMRSAAGIALQHHERWDGDGYPQGLKGEEIALFARIVCLADVFDALSHRRIYKEAWTLDETLAQIRWGSGHYFDPNLVRCFFEVLEGLLAVQRTYPDE